MKERSSMQLDPKFKRTREWLSLAKSDLASGRHQLTAPDPFTRQATFQAQQSAEKALKSFLVWHQIRFTKQHDIRYLGDLVLEKEPAFKAAIDEAVDLNPYAVTIRYPGYSDEPSVEEAEKALSLAEKLFSEILSRLPKDVYP